MKTILKADTLSILSESILEITGRKRGFINNFLHLSLSVANCSQLSGIDNCLTARVEHPCSSLLTIFFALYFRNHPPYVPYPTQRRCFHADFDRAVLGFVKNFYVGNKVVPYDSHGWLWYLHQDQDKTSDVFDRVPRFRSHKLVLR